MQRREFGELIGKGALLCGAGALHLGGDLNELFEQEKRLDFGKLEPLVALMQDTSANKLLPKLVLKLQRGVTLETLVAAAALANARSFGGTDYVGFHAAMALVPALQMSRQMPPGKEAIPVLKVIHRNTTRIRQQGGRDREALRPIGKQKSKTVASAQSLLAAERRLDQAAVERQFAKAIDSGPASAYEILQPLVRENIDVHQVVLAWRSWDLLRLTGAEHAHTMLRQVARHAVDRESARRRKGRRAPSLRSLLPTLISDLGLDQMQPGTKRLGAKSLSQLTTKIFCCGRDQTARIMAETLAHGTHPLDAGEALSLASVKLLLHDRGRTRGERGKPIGSVHGASVGIHASDSAMAWRGIAAVSGPQNTFASLIAGAWHTAGQSRQVGSKPFHLQARQSAAKIKPHHLAAALAESMKTGDQPCAAAIGERWLESGANGDDAFRLILKEMVEFDGSLHHEKFFRTCFEGFSASSQTNQSSWIAAAARVAASGHGLKSQGYRLAADLL